MKSKLIVFLLFASPFVGMAHQPAFQMVSLKKTGTAWQLVYSETMAQLEAARFEPNDFIPYLSILADGKPLALSVNSQGFFQDGIQLHLASLNNVKSITIRFDPRAGNGQSTRIFRLEGTNRQMAGANRDDVYASFLKKNDQTIRLVFLQGHWQIENEKTDAASSHWLTVLYAFVSIVSLAVFLKVAWKHRVLPHKAIGNKPPGILSSSINY